MVVTHIHSDSEFESILNNNKGGAGGGNKLFLVDYSANWCGPCKQIAPVFESLSNKYGHGNFQFLKVDVDECSDSAQSQRVSGLPTFVFYKNTLSTELHRITGANASALESKIQELAPNFQAHFGGQGNKLGGDAGGSSGRPNVQAGSSSSSNLSSEEIIQIAQANVDYSLASCCRVGVRFQPIVSIGGSSGVKPFLRINSTEPISKLRAFIDSLLEMSGINGQQYELHNSYPPGKLDETVSISDGGLAGAIVVVKFS